MFSSLSETNGFLLSMGLKLLRYRFKFWYEHIFYFYRPKDKVPIVSNLLRFALKGSRNSQTKTTSRLENSDCAVISTVSDHSPSSRSITTERQESPIGPHVVTFST